MALTALYLTTIQIVCLFWGLVIYLFWSLVVCLFWSLVVCLIGD